MLISIVVLVLIGVGVYAAMNRPSPETNTESEESAMVKETPTGVSGEEAMMEEVKEIVVEGSAFKFVPDAITLKKGEKTRIIFKNTGGMHDFVVDELGVRTKITNTGEEDSVEFTAEESGIFEFYCSIGNHRELGMRGTLIVEE